MLMKQSRINTPRYFTMKKKLVFILVFVLSSSWIISQEDRPKGLLIHGNIPDIQKVIKTNERKVIYAVSHSLRTISHSKNVHLLHGNPDFLNKVKKSLSTNPEVMVAEDQIVEYRMEPNDQYFNSQWSLNKIRAVDAWINTTGGKDANNNDVVIAVLDDGYDINHEDLENNIFVNAGEIPNDNLDNDMNGYVDDYKGLNINMSNDSHPVLDHGTSVLGIIGASSNNSIGISGINWNCKLLTISGVKNTSAIIEAYEYIKKMKSLYIASDGQMGANIVVTSFSGGVPNQFPDNFPYSVWCELYNELGQLGVLSVAATTNESIDVDVAGDMASTCESPYLIVVNATTIDDERALSTGYGSLSVDIGAPGINILTTTSNDDYNRFDGTSAATPHVAGAIALIHSLKCENLDNLKENNPAAAAMIIRDALFVGGESLEDLDVITTTGKRLDILGTMQELQDLCDGNLNIPSKVGPVEIEIINRIGNLIYLQYVTPDENNYTLRITNHLGQIVFVQEITPPKYGLKSLTFPFVGYPIGLYYLSLEGPLGVDTRVIFYNQ